MKYLKTFENGDKKYVILAYDAVDTNDISVCIESEYYDPFSFSDIKTLEEDNLQVKYYTLLDAKNELKKRINNFKFTIFQILTIDDFEILVNSKKYNI